MVNRFFVYKIYKTLYLKGLDDKMTKMSDGAQYIVLGIKNKHNILCFSLTFRVPFDRMNLHG